MSTAEQATEPTSAPVDERAEREAELYQLVKSADAAVTEASRAPKDESADWAAWWRRIADAHTTAAEAYQAAVRSGLWPYDSLVWTALMEAKWHNEQEAKRAKHEADLLGDQAKARAERVS